MRSQFYGPLVASLLFLPATGCSRPVDHPSPAASTAASGAPNTVGPTDAATQAEQKREALGKLGAAVTGQPAPLSASNTTSP